MDDGRAKKLNQRWENPEISNSASTPMAGRITGLGVVTEFRSQRVTTRIWSCGGASTEKREGGRHSRAPLFIACVLVNLLSVPPIGQTHPWARRQWNMGNVVAYNTEKSRGWWGMAIREKNKKAGTVKLSCHPSEANIAVTGVGQASIGIFILPFL